MFKGFCLQGIKKGTFYLSLNQSHTEDFPVAKEKRSDK